MLAINERLSLPLSEVELTAIRAQGAGGQNLHKTSSAAQLRFDIQASSLPEDCKQRLLQKSDRRISHDGVIVIKAQQHRSLEQNREAALERLRRMIEAVAVAPRPRRTTRPSRAAKARRVDDKTQRGKLKSLRGRVDD